MKERPILFSAPMVRAILEGRKTQTRREVKRQPSADTTLVEWNTAAGAFVPWNWHSGGYPSGGHRTGKEFACPYGVPGDLLYVREAYKFQSPFDQLPPSAVREDAKVFYLADDGYAPKSRYRHARFMPRWASRITLKVTDVRVERLQEISETDAADEGVGALVSGAREGNPDQYRATFRDLWSEINGADSWAANPWVWVVSFERQP